MSDIEALRLSLPFWDEVAALTAIAILVGAVGPLLVEFTRFRVPRIWKSRVTAAWAALLIIGTGGQIVAQRSAAVCRCGECPPWN